MKRLWRDCPGGPMAKIHTPNAGGFGGVTVRSLVRELGPHAATKISCATVKDPTCCNWDLAWPNKYKLKKKKKNRKAMEFCHSSGTSPLDKHWGAHPDYGWDIFSLQCRAGHGALLLTSTGGIPPAHRSCGATAPPAWGPPVPLGSHKQDPLLKDAQLLLSSY